MSCTSTSPCRSMAGPISRRSSSWSRPSAASRYFSSSGYVTPLPFEGFQIVTRDITSPAIVTGGSLPMEQVRHLGFVLKDVYRLWVRLFEQRLPQLGMTFTQCKVLV